MNKIEWKEIPGYEGRYLVSKCGKVWSNFSNKELSPSIKKSGYSSVSLCINGVTKYYLVHRLVADQFCEKREGCEYVNHILPILQGGTNHADNLEWVSRQENSDHRTLLGNTGKGGTKNGRSVNQIDPNNGNILATFKSISEAGRSTNTDIGSIGHIVKGTKGRGNKAGGYKWEYADQKRI